MVGFNFYAEYIMRNAGLEEAQAGDPRLLWRRQTEDYFQREGGQRRASS